MSDGERESGTEGEASASAEATTSGAAEKPEAGSTKADAAKPASAKPAARKTPAEAPRPSVTTAQWAFLLVVAIVTAGLDLWSKSWAIKRLSMPNFRSVPLCTPPPGAQHYMYQRIPTREVTVVRNYLDFRYAENCGGAWGLLHGARENLRKPFFMLVTLGAVAFIVHLYRSLEQNQRMMRWALPLVLGGAIGNLVDRVRLGYVVDFIDMHIKERYHWPTYNIADIAITVGIALMLLEYILGPRRDRVEQKRAAKPAATA